MAVVGATCPFAVCQRQGLRVLKGRVCGRRYDIECRGCTEWGAAGLRFFAAAAFQASSALRNPWAGDKHPSRSRDSQEIVFRSNRSGLKQIYILAADGSNVRRISSALRAGSGRCQKPIPRPWDGPGGHCLLRTGTGDADQV